MRLSILRTAYQDRFDLSGVSADLARAIQVAEEALAVTPDEHPDRVTQLRQLSAAYQRRFDRHGTATDLDRAVQLAEQALATTPDGHPDQAALMFNLSIICQMYFDHRGLVIHLDRAVQLAEQALATTPRDHPDRATRLGHLSITYQRRFDRHGTATDLDRAVQLAEQALATTPRDHPDRATKLGELSMAYHKRFDRRGTATDLDRAVQLAEEAVAAIPDDHPRRAFWLGYLGIIHQAQFARSGLLDHLNEMIRLFEQALAKTSEDHPQRASILGVLGSAYQKRIDAAGHGPDARTLHALAEQVRRVTTASPTGQISAGHAVGALALAMGEHHTAVQLLDAATALSPVVVPRESDWADQEHRVGGWPSLAAETISAHCAVKDPVGAVEFAELGRGILLAAHLDSRTDLTDLDHELPELAARFRYLRNLLDETPAMGVLPTGTATRFEDRRRWWIEHDELLTRIRQHPRFARFLLPPQMADLQSAAGNDAVILVNSGQSRSDAIIITAEAKPTQIRLPDLTFTDVKSCAGALLNAHSTSHRPRTPPTERVIAEILGWLWDTVVAPVLDTALPVSSGESKPRVWWLPIGWLSLFPLHAASHPGQPGALDRVVSSYTATLRTLAHTRARPAAAIRRQLTVALEHTPDMPDLPGTATEAASLQARHSDTRLLVNQHGTTGEVVRALRNATWAHFACHATADFSAPSRSGLRLHDSTLSIPDIARLQLTHAELTYLSACSTAHRGIQHADECINLASAFQLAGFRHVIATLWPLPDRIAATASHTFYHHLPTNHATDHVATALHSATHELRSRYPNRPDVWAPLIHTGP